MSYNIYGEHLEFEREIIRSDDIVSVVSVLHMKLKERDTNWLTAENLGISVGDKFTVSKVSKDYRGLWLHLNNLRYARPIEKFSKVDKK